MLLNKLMLINYNISPYALRFVVPVMHISILIVSDNRELGLSTTFLTLLASIRNTLLNIHHQQHTIPSPDIITIKSIYVEKADVLFGI